MSWDYMEKGIYYWEDEKWKRKGWWEEGLVEELRGGVMSGRKGEGRWRPRVRGMLLLMKERLVNHSVL